MRSCERSGVFSKKIQKSPEYCELRSGARLCGRSKRAALTSAAARGSRGEVLTYPSERDPAQHEALLTLPLMALGWSEVSGRGKSGACADSEGRRSAARRRRRAEARARGLISKGGYA